MLDTISKEREEVLTLSTWPKPRLWSFLQTETEGTYKVILEGPDKKQSLLTEISVVVPKEQIATISVRTALGLADKPKPELTKEEL